MITALLTLVLAFQTNAPYVSRIPIDPANPPPASKPNCSYREDPPRPMPDEYLDLRVSTTPLPDPAIDPNTGQYVDAFIRQPINARSSLPASWTILIIECQATDDQWAQIDAGVKKETSSIVISSQDLDCPADGSGMYFNFLRGSFQCVGVGPIVDPVLGEQPPDPTSAPWVDPPATVCLFMPGSASATLMQNDKGNGWLYNWQRDTDAGSLAPIQPIPCDASLGYALLLTGINGPVATLTPYNMGSADVATCLTDDGSDWFFNTTTFFLKQCAQMLADDQTAADLAAYYAANPLPVAGVQDPVNDPLGLLCNGLPCGTLNSDTPQ